MAGWRDAIGARRRRGVAALMLACAAVLPAGANDLAAVPHVQAPVPAGCRPERQRVATVWECHARGPEGGFLTFALISGSVPAASHLAPHLFAPEQDAGAVLELMTGNSLTGIDMPGARMLEQSVTPVAAERIPAGAEICALVSKHERVRAELPDGVMTPPVHIETRELHCVARGEPGRMLEVLAIFAATYVPDFGEAPPADFEARAADALSRVAVLP